VQLLTDGVVLISGGAQGVGAGVARAAAREGASVVVTGRRHAPGEALVRELRATGAIAAYVPADVADVASARASVAFAVERFGRVDCLVNAATQCFGSSMKEGVDQSFEYFTGRVLPRLQAARVQRVTLTGGESFMHPDLLAMCRGGYRLEEFRVSVHHVRPTGTGPGSR
jgi:NAD(P)-dependent dehydrogenase (short-subunit alcohol dehydrogenase family)